MRANTYITMFIALLSGTFSDIPITQAYDDTALSTCFNAATDGKFSSEALDACTRVVEDNTAPAHIRLAGLQCRAMLYKAQGMLDRAAADFTEHIRLAPDQPRGYTARGNIRMKQGNYRGVVKDMTAALAKKAAEQDPLSSMTKGEVLAAYYTRAQALEQLGQIDRAIDDYRNAGSLGKEDVERLQTRY